MGCQLADVSTASMSIFTPFEDFVVIGQFTLPSNLAVPVPPKQRPKIQSPVVDHHLPNENINY